MSFCDPFLCAARSDDGVFELLVQRFTAFTAILSIVLGALLLQGAIPRLLGLVVGCWIAAVLAARLYLRLRRREFGRVLVDFERGECRGQRRSGQEFRADLADVRLATERALDNDAPVWLLLELAGGPLRLGRATSADANRIITLFRTHHVEVVQRHEQGGADKLESS